jgi:hypothetical protein
VELPFNEEMCDFLRSQVVLSNGLHEFNYFFLDAGVLLHQGLIVLLHLEFDLREEGGVECGGLNLPPIFVLCQEGLADLAAEHLVHLLRLHLLQLQRQLFNQSLLAGSGLHLAEGGDVSVELGRVEAVWIEALLEEVGLESVGDGGLLAPHLDLEQAEGEQQVLHHGNGLVGESAVGLVDAIFDARVVGVVFVELEVEPGEGCAQTVLLELLDVVGGLQDGRSKYRLDG